VTATSPNAITNTPKTLTTTENYVPRSAFLSAAALCERRMHSKQSWCLSFGGLVLLPGLALIVWRRRRVGRENKGSSSTNQALVTFTNYVGLSPSAVVSARRCRDGVDAVLSPPSGAATVGVAAAAASSRGAAAPWRRSGSESSLAVGGSESGLQLAAYGGADPRHHAHPDFLNGGRTALPRPVRRRFTGASDFSRTGGTCVLCASPPHHPPSPPSLTILKQCVAHEFAQSNEVVTGALRAGVLSSKSPVKTAARATERRTRIFNSKSKHGSQRAATTTPPRQVRLPARADGRA
jgi:hypothetical protein